MKRRTVRVRAHAGRAASLVAAAAAAGCATLGGGGVSLAGTWDGVLEAESSTYAVTLRLEDRFRGVHLEIESAIGLSARGDGRIRGGYFSAEAPYDTGCPGTLVLSGEILEEGALLVGTFTAQDCTGETSGGFRVRRRGALTPLSPPA